jgi:hypothetical protein
MATNDYRCPPKWMADGKETAPDKILAWVKEALTQGMTFLKSQRAYKDIDKAMDIIADSEDEFIPKSRSRMRYNRLKRQIREVVATEANIRPLDGFSTDNPETFGEQSEILNKTWRGWWLGTFADRAWREAVQYAAVLGTGYLIPSWVRDFWFAGRGDIQLTALGPLDVIPIQIGKDNDLQKAYAVALVVEVPLATAHAMFPAYQDKITATRDKPGWFRRGVEKLKRFAGPALNTSGSGKKTSDSLFPTVDIYHIYVRDLSVNYTGKTIPMGLPGSNWYYEVPSVGSQIDTGMKDKDNRPLFRTATAEDCMLYPNRRLLICTENCLIGDDASPRWDGRVPVVQLKTDDWPWDFLGYSLTRDAHPLNVAIVELLRQIQDSGNCRLRPKLQYDSNISPTTMDSVDTRAPGGAVGVDFSMGEGIKPLLPADYYEVPPWIPQHIEGLEQRMDYLLAVTDMATISKARQIPASDSLEKLTQLAGPIVQDISRGMERSYRDLADMVKSMFFQFYSLKRRIILMGQAGITKDDFVMWDPANLLPGSLPGDTQAQRAKFLSTQMTFQVTPNSLHSIQQVSRQLMFLQLFRSGTFPMDPWTLAEVLDVPNFGNPPAGATTVYDRWKAWMSDRTEFMATMQMLAQSMMPQAPGLTPDGGGGAAGPGAEAAPVGRPPSGSAPPKLVMKDGGTRVAVSESR